jgi:hypothetical protein
MKRVTTTIKVQDKNGKFWTFTWANSITIESRFDKLTDRANIVLPKKVAWKKDAIEGVIVRGGKVEVWAGYDFRQDKIFEGYISEVHTKIPFEIDCQDASWILKQTSIKSKSYQNVTLKALLLDVCPIPFEAIDVNLGQFRIVNVTVAQLLDELNKTYALRSFVREGKLFCGLAFYPNSAKDFTFTFEENVISNDLEYKRAEDVKIKVKAISILPTNKKIEKELGDPDGELRTLPFYNLSEAELVASATRELERLKVEGYEGSFTTFGQPTVRHGDRVRLIDTRLGRNGVYLVKGVKTTGTTSSGLKQVITLDAKIA